MPFGDKLQKFAVAFVAAFIAVAAGVAMTHVGRGPDRAAAVDDATPTVGEGRNLTREILRARREHAEAPAEVRPDPTLGERQRIETKEVVARDPAPKDTKEHVAAKESPKAKVPNVVAAVALPRSRPEGAGDTAPQAAPGTAPAVASVDPPPEQSRSIGSMVFSTVSDLSGKAANLTGDTANFVIELPGKLIAAGGRLFERPQPQPPKREAL
jgi:hypothetical protein